MNGFPLRLRRRLWSSPPRLNVEYDNGLADSLPI